MDDDSTEEESVKEAEEEQLEKKEEDDEIMEEKYDGNLKGDENNIETEKKGGRKQNLLKVKKE